MANNYVLFSTAIENLTKKELKWWRQLLELQLSGDDDPKPTIEAISDQLGVPAHCLDDEPWPDFEFKIEEEIQSVWFHADEWGDAYKLSMAIHAFLKKFRPKEIFHFSVAYTCSSPRLDEFNGEEYVISKDGIFSNLSTTRMFLNFLENKRRRRYVLNDCMEIIVQKVSRKKGKK